MDNVTKLVVMIFILCLVLDMKLKSIYNHSLKSFSVFKLHSHHLHNMNNIVEEFNTLKKISITVDITNTTVASD